MPKTINLPIDLEIDEEIISLVQAVAGNEMVAQDEYIIIPRAALQKTAHELHQALLVIEGSNDLEAAHVEQGLWDWFIDQTDIAIRYADTRAMVARQREAIASHITAARLLAEVRSGHDHQN